jgi:hypothetical protein
MLNTLLLLVVVVALNLAAAVVVAVVLELVHELHLLPLPIIPLL